jgi:hypothetical protein
MNKYDDEAAWDKSGKLETKSWFSYFRVVDTMWLGILTANIRVGENSELLKCEQRGRTLLNLPRDLVISTLGSNGISGEE